MAPVVDSGKSTLEIVTEILGPATKSQPAVADERPYDAPVAVAAGDVNALQDLDERRLIELKEVCRSII